MSSVASVQFTHESKVVVKLLVDT